jgi:large subunit ribosomal protein L30
MPDIKVTQVRSSIGVIPKHRGTLRALGLRKIGMTNVLPDRPEVRGMIAQVPYLIKVEELSTSERTNDAVSTRVRLARKA